MIKGQRFPRRKWFRTFTLLGCRLEEWLLYHSGVSDLSIMSNYSDGVWFQEMIRADDTDGDDGAHDLVMR
jgi:hypothetical protein